MHRSPFLLGLCKVILKQQSSPQVILKCLLIYCRFRDYKTIKNHTHDLNNTGDSAFMNIFLCDIGLDNLEMSNLMPSKYVNSSGYLFNSLDVVATNKAIHIITVYF